MCNITGNEELQKLSRELKSTYVTNRTVRRKDLVKAQTVVLTFPAYPDSTLKSFQNSMANHN